MNFTFKTIQQFNDYFKVEKSCYKFLEKQRWNNKPVCPHCGSEKHYKVKCRGKSADIPAYRCGNRTCDLPFSVRIKSILEGSRIELRKWLQAIFEISTAKKGISSIELSVRIGISQKSAWFMNHKIREMLEEAEPEMMSVVVEADEAFVGGKNKNRHANKKAPKSQGRAHVDKTAVVGLVQRNGKIKTFVVPDTNSETLHKLMIENVSQDAVLITDAYKSYNGLEKLYNHITVKHTDNNYITDSDFHTNNIEGFWSLLKRGIIGTFHSVSRKHFHRYCTEFSSRYNYKDVSNVVRFANAIQNSNKQRTTYQKLTANVE